MDFFDYVKNNKIITLLFGTFIIILIILSIFFLNFKNEKIEEKIAFEDIKVNKNEEEKFSPKEFYVEIKGQVKKPSVYKVNEDNIINDLINLAGGLKKDAYTNNINLSKKLTEELVVYVYSKNEYKKLNKPHVITEFKTVTVYEPCETKTYDIKNCTDNLQSEIISGHNDTSFNNKNITLESNSNNKININTASKEELLTLTGIGESKAIAIINYRNNNGFFKKIDDILNVSGIGNSIFEKIKDSITI